MTTSSWALLSALLWSAAAPTGRYQKPDQDTVLDVQTQLLWQATALPPSTQAAASSACAALASHGGGWRLPRVTELASLVDEREAYSPVLDTGFFSLQVELHLWSSSSGGSVGQVWVLDASSGATQPRAVTGQASALCVHDL